MYNGDKISTATVLFVDDEREILSSLKRLVRKLDAQCLFATSGAEALQLMAQNNIDVIVSDMRMPEMNGAELLASVADFYPESIRIVLSGHSDSDMVMAAVNEGRIWSYINKPWDDEQLILTLEQAIYTQQLIAERALLRRTLAQYQLTNKEQFQGFIGRSVPMQFIYSAIERAAPSSASVFITGASGTGKELAAKAIHDLSQRASKPFLTLNCAAIPNELIESEIFGHVKGAFSGAISHRDGAATLADGGTLFLDELSEMDIGLQAKLLRFIQTGTFQKVGSSTMETVSIRFICATNRDPLVAIKDNKLREDLYYRLNVISLNLPALSDRDADPVLLAQHFVHHYAQLENKDVVGLSQQAELLISQYPWPGNVRQLENCIYSCVVMATESLLDNSDLINALSLSDTEAEPLLHSKPRTAISTVEHQASPPCNEPMLPQHIVPLAEVEKAAIQQAISICDDKVVKAAGYLEVSPSTLYRKMQAWEN
ncbi:sigma-54-dependent transcriptional regulator [Ferrimonas lipolytica]|uniref:Sigma-54-dependent Fis family transcriptional regulator n=1 Tax=Ferrimonas lipolytica TaxID=2724191 RepID=A0A6H1UDR3_9GAMM|nr:sigma-54 dependent transcriptional regulator [Ferrimonas lipolytica]QIZ76356.1 sigma-54-dependent Fis family transcriptional regulator [Ferrimonas lipolytica]